LVPVSNTNSSGNLVFSPVLKKWIPVLVQMPVLKVSPVLNLVLSFLLTSEWNLLTYNLASLSGPNSARARTHLTLSLMKQFRSNRLTLH
jgi:hypothetical protein